MLARSRLLQYQIVVWRCPAHDFRLKSLPDCASSIQSARSLPGHPISLNSVPFGCWPGPPVAVTVLLAREFPTGLLAPGITEACAGRLVLSFSHTAVSTSQPLMARGVWSCRRNNPLSTVSSAPGITQEDPDAGKPLEPVRGQPAAIVGGQMREYQVAFSARRRSTPASCMLYGLPRLPRA